MYLAGEIVFAIGFFGMALAAVAWIVRIEPLGLGTRRRAALAMLVSVTVVVVGTMIAGSEDETPAKAESSEPHSTATPNAAKPTSTPRSTPRPAGFITRADYGSDWPFTVESGQLACTGSGGFGAVTLKANGHTYAVNGIARGSENLRKNGWTDGDAIFVLGTNINRVIADGLKLCK